MLVLFVFIAFFIAGGGGFLVAWQASGRLEYGLAGAAAALILALVAGVSTQALKRVPLRTVLGGAIGAGTGFALASLGAAALPPRFAGHPVFGTAILAGVVCLGYLGLALGAKKGDEFSLPEIVSLFRAPGTDEANQKILDTSVIIDGRIADICETGFLDGTLVIPQFVLRELQYIADSPDSLKRNRGRRGLDILQRMQKKTDLDVEITEQDFPRIREVDAKLIALGRDRRAKIITNDFNLNKVAELQGVSVLNINQLANALKPVLLPGELMRVQILREGKEQGQGVAYLDDGTMVVVDNGRKLIGKNVEVLVTSVLQTSAGRMIFSQLKDNGQGDPSASGATPGGAAR